MFLMFFLMFVMCLKKGDERYSDIRGKPARVH